MSKIICDVCGTSYPETAAQCPICGCVRPADSQSVMSEGGTEDAKSAGYTYVKGGRFSKANVRKRAKAKQNASYETAEVLSDTDPEGQEKGGKGLVITILVLLLAIVAVAIYIVVRMFGPAAEPAPSTTTTAATTTETTMGEIACTSLQLSNSEVSLTELGEAWVLDVSAEPADTTDTLRFETDDPLVAQVDEKGKVTAIGPGQAIITITCGDVVQQCRVICQWVEETTEDTTAPTEESTEETTAATTAPEDTELRLNREDFTLNYEGHKWDLYNGSIPEEDITWTSDDETVATIENGVVTAVGNGVTKVHAQYNGVKVSCIVRCSINETTESTGVSGNGGDITEDKGDQNTDNDNASTKTYQIWSNWGTHSSFTVSVGESFRVLLKDSDGNTVEATWSVSNGEICTISGNTVTAAASGTVSIVATYNGTKYYASVLVK